MSIAKRGFLTSIGYAIIVSSLNAFTENVEKNLKKIYKNDIILISFSF